ncbi:hypothetical protein M422DRAFT_268358 [Sphaerobolus stellatus SS14]|uniref:Uncharacterized protein n=1 Tax=Sphaerobolus stellatus (strain SS14) TaxID=990650 RepID=A0A0C9UXK8_SPHS4|nr:hypothetical protein M422DRAFT_268358 [Sphaerobolus stellatus SS14]
MHYASGDIFSGCNQTTSKACAQKYIKHPENSIIEFPETGSLPNEAIVHIFSLQPGDSKEDFDPKLNIQYGIWGKHGSCPNVCLFLFPQEKESFTVCSQFKAECMGVKECNSHGYQDSSGTNVGVQSLIPFIDSAEQEVFMKILGFFCALMQNGCLFNLEMEPGDLDDGESDKEDASEDASEPPFIFYETLCDIRSIKQDTPKCNGKLVFQQDHFGHSFIQCKKCQKGHRAHLIICNLNEFNLNYLHALFEEDFPKILGFEKRAASAGYGPLIPCNFVSGILAMIEENASLPHEQVYVHCAEKHDILGE